MNLKSEIYTLNIKINSREAMINFGKILGNIAKPNTLYALLGDLGAGKTTLTKGIGEALGVKETINSPTFTIMKTYKTANNEIPVLYHLDVYRIENSKSDFDLEEYFYMGGCTVIEWANQIIELIPDDTVWIEILNISENTRMLTIRSTNEKLIENIEKTCNREGVLE